MVGVSVAAATVAPVVVPDVLNVQGEFVVGVATTAYHLQEVVGGLWVHKHVVGVEGLSLEGVGERFFVAGLLLFLVEFLGRLLLVAPYLVLLDLLIYIFM